jgi:dihydroorotase
MPDRTQSPSSPPDLAVRSRRILTTGGWLDGTIEIRGGRIAALHRGEPPVQAERIVDATDRTVLPGLVDTHAHMRDPGFTQKEDWTHGSRAALAGGVTTAFDMPNVDPPPTTVERFLAHRANAAAQAATDFGHNASATIPEEIPGLAAEGAAAFKVFMARDARKSYPHMPGIAVDDHALLYEIFEAVAATGRVLMVHPQDTALHELFSRRAIEREGRGFRSYARALRDGNGAAIDSGVATILALQRATGVRLHVLHVNTRGAIRMIRDAKAEGRPVTAEANPFHLFVVNRWERIERYGPYVLGQWVPDADGDALWEAVLDGTIDVLGSDHTPHTREEKERGWEDMFSTPGGSPTIQHYLGLLLTASTEGRISLERIAALAATGPADLLGLDGRKGSIQVGGDADLVVVHEGREWLVRNEDVLSKCGWTALDGWTLRGLPTMTIRRGEIVMEDGRVLAAPGSGRHVAIAGDSAG